MDGSRASRSRRWAGDGSGHASTPSTPRNMLSYNRSRSVVIIYQARAQTPFARRCGHKEVGGFHAATVALGDGAFDSAAAGSDLGRMIDDLYSAKVLALAANLPRLGRLARPDASCEKVSKLCGSRVLVDVAVADGRVADFAQEVD